MFTHHSIRRNAFLFAAAVAALCVQMAHAQNVPTVTFDEAGKGLVQIPGAAPVVMPSLGNITDPFDASSGMKPLAYNFVGVTGVVPTDGDVIMSELDPNGVSALSDVVRFEHGLILVYSDKPTPGETFDIADVGLPSLFQQNKLSVLETGPEVGPNGLFGYSPAVGQPGSLSAPIIYNFTSDATPTPEPGSLMAILPAGALLLIRRRRPIA